jgi:hypothetical protein
MYQRYLEFSVIAKSFIINVSFCVYVEHRVKQRGHQKVATRKAVGDGESAATTL